MTKTSSSKPAVKAVKSRVLSTLSSAKKTALNVRAKAVAGAKATDKVVRAHPYKAIAVAVGAGLVAGAIMGRRRGAKPAAPKAA